MSQPVSVLLVDDSPSFLQAAAKFLEGEEGIVVAGTALGGREALVKVQALRPDVVTVDLAMPDIPGLALIPRLRAVAPGLGIVALTMYDTTGYRQAAMRAGADELVGKATMGEDLLPAIWQAARAHGLEDPSIGRG